MISGYKEVVADEYLCQGWHAFTALLSSDLAIERIINYNFPD